jgi:Rrf2 family transcriptional regulator, nitric oxide-sensitive transcriptional repressor
MLSRTAEYALRAIVWLSDHPETSITGQALAAATQVPPDYLAKVMQCLVRAGLVEAQRGKNGGFSLVSTPEDTTILDVINAVEPVRRIRTCPLGLAGHESLCPLHRSLDNIAGQLERAYGAIRLADLLRSAGVKPLCPVAEAPHA